MCGGGDYARFRFKTATCSGRCGTTELLWLLLQPAFASSKEEEEEVGGATDCLSKIWILVLIIVNGEVCAGKFSPED